MMVKRLGLALRNALPGVGTASRRPPETVETVDLERLLGTWFEVARLPSLESDSPWQRAVNVTATYAKGADGRITVHTVSYNAKARLRRSEVKGTVQPADSSNAKLVLKFFKLIRGDLWIIGLDPDYQWALMGTPSRKRLWLIARAPSIDTADYDQAVAIATAQGYDAARLQPTAQGVAV